MNPRTILLAGIALGNLLFACSCTSSLRPVDCPPTLTIGDRTVSFSYSDTFNDQCVYYGDRDPNNRVKVWVWFINAGGFVHAKN